MSLLREATGTGTFLGARWVVANSSYSYRAVVKGMRDLGLHLVRRLRRDFVLRFPYTGPHAARLACTPLAETKRSTSTTGTNTAEPGSVGSRWSTSCCAGPTR